MKLYETKTYLIIIHFKNFETHIRNTRESELETLIKRLNKMEDVLDYVITRKMEYEDNEIQ